MARYTLGTGHGGTPQAMTTTYKTLVSVTAATGATTLRRGWIYDIMVGADGTPADNAMTFKVDRQTTVGTATSSVPSPIDVGNAACLLVGSTNNTIEPTVTAATQLVELGMNQRASYRWVAAPGGELVVPATNVAGIGARVKSPGYTGTMVCTVQFWE